MTRVFTVGHSDRTFAEVLQLLDDHDINALVDVRRFPSSRKHPQWNQSSIVAALPAGYSYTWVSELGGRRHTPRGVPSPNGGWRVKAFQDYADHMLGEEFAHGLDQLIDLSRDALSVIMCSEAVPWRCHRRLITDALLVAGIEVTHIISRTTTQVAALSDHGRFHDDQLTYPREATASI